jgi:hypothetical protein
LNGNGDPGSQGIELDAYPTLRSLVIGANLKFNTMKEIYISLFVVSAYFISGCSNDYLDVDQTETISTKDIALFNNNDQGAATFVNAIYNKFWTLICLLHFHGRHQHSDDADKGSSLETQGR